MRFILLAALSVLALSTATAHEVRVGDYSVQVTPIATIQGAAGEDQMVTLARAAAVLDAYTAEHQVEACGAVMSNADNVFRIQLGTIGSHVACVSDETAQEGFTVTSQRLTIHSHPPRSTYLANAVDVALAANVDNRNAQGHQASVRLGQPLRVEGEGFSNQDFQRPGWLVVRGRLLYQGGPQNVHDLGAIAALLTGPVSVAQLP